MDSLCIYRATSLEQILLHIGCMPAGVPDLECFGACFFQGKTRFAQLRGEVLAKALWQLSLAITKAIYDSVFI